MSDTRQIHRPRAGTLADHMIRLKIGQSLAVPNSKRQVYKALNRYSGLMFKKFEYQRIKADLQNGTSVSLTYIERIA